MEFPTREGTDNPGSDYEKEIAALLALRYTFEPSVQDFWIGTNVDCVGDTDDVVLCITPENGEKLALLLQLKHENPVGEPKQFKPTDFTYVGKDKAKDRFSVNKYYKGYQKFQNHLKSSEEQPELIKYLGTIKKFVYLFYTNRGLEGKLNCLINANENVFLDQLNTSNTNYYGFNIENFNLDEEFIQNLYVFPNQINYDGVFKLIKAEIRKQFGVKYKFAKLRFADVTKRYLEIIKLWTKGCEIGKKLKYMALSKRDVINILSDILLKPYKCDIEDNKFSYYDCPQKNIWNKLMLLKHISIVYGNDLTVQFLKDYIGSEVKLYIKNQGRYDYWKADVAKLASASNAFCEPISDDQIQMIKICGNTDNDCISIISVYKLMWFYKSLPLLLEIEDEEEYNDIIKILKISKNELKVIIITNDEDFQCQKIKHVNLFSSLNDLAPSEQLEILNLPVRFQGRISVPLSEITKKSMLEYLKCQDIIQILCNDFNVGNKFEFNCECYINRSVLKILIAFEALVEIKNEFFLIEVQNRKECEQILNEKLESFGVEINGDSQICILESSSVTKNIAKLKKSHDRFHRLLFHEGSLEWKESTGSIENIARFQMFDDNYTTEILFDDDSNFLNSINTNKFQIISACPGMGKSVLLDYITCYASSRVWILPVILRTIAENDEIKDEPSTFFTFYIDELFGKDSKVQNKEFSSMVFNDMVETKNILLLLDGFDEISILYKEQFSDLIEYLYNKNYPIIITTRQNMEIFLEDKFKVLSVHFKSLNFDEQKQYLTSFFKINVPVKNKNAIPILENFVDQLLDAADYNLSERDEEFTGIPLQLQLLAKNFLGECKASIKAKKVCLTTKFDLLDLYDKFIKHKTVILCEKYGASEKQWLQSLESNQHLFALQYLFDDYNLKDLNIKRSLQQYYEKEEYTAQLLQKDGILIAKQRKDKIDIDFIHRTFAEYLAAKWLTKNVKIVEMKETIARLINLRFSNHYKFLFVVFDRILAKQCPFHLDIINVKVDDIKSKLESNPNIFIETDKINRSAFHLFSLYANEYREEDLIEIFDNNLLKKFNLDTLDNTTSYSPLDYALFRDSWTFANKLCELSQYLRINTYDISYTFIEELCYKYKNLYLTVFHNYLCRDLLLGELHEDTSILYYTSEFCKKVGLSRDIFKLVKSASTVGEYLKICKIRDSTRYYYHDIRFAIAFGSKINVENLLLAKELDINEKDSSNNNTLLHYATIYKRSDIIKILLNKGADVNIPGRDESTVVHYAARGGCNDILEMYIAKNVDVNRKDGSHCTPMNIAIDSKNSHIALTLLRLNAEISDSVLFDIHTVLHNVVEFGNVELLQGLIKRGHDINAKLLSGCTVLHTALASNRVDMAKILIKNNCDFKSDSASDSLLHLTAKTGDLELLHLFLSSGLSVNKGNHIGKTPLIIAIENDHVEFSKVLISNNADVFAESKYEDVFTLAIRKGNDEIVSLLMEKGCDVNKRDNNGDTPLLIALHENKLNIVNLLLQNNADVYAQNNFGYTTLHCSAMYGYQDLVTTFLDYGVDINKKTNDFNDTALLLALKNNWIEVTKLLLLSIPEVNVVNKQKCNALHYAAKFGDITLVEDLISAGAEINLQNDIGLTPLDEAVLNKKSDIAELLLSSQGDAPLKINKRYPFLLHIAASAGNDEIITLCLEQKFDINEQDYQGKTPLLCALENKKFETAKLLIENGGDISLKCKKQHRTLHYAARIGFDDLVKDILEEGCDINEINSLGDTALCTALLSSNINTAKLLRSKGAEIDIKRRDRSTTVHLAASCGYNELIMECIDKGYEINSLNFDGNLPIDYAIMENKFDSVKILIDNGAIPSLLTFDLYVDMKVQSDPEIKEKIKYFGLLLEKFGNINLNDKHGNTILHYICYSDFIGYNENDCNDGENFYREAVKIVLELGASFEINNKDGKSAYDLAVGKNLESIVLIFDQNILKQ